MGFIPGMQWFISMFKAINVIHPINKLKNLKPYDHMNRGELIKFLTKFNTHLWLKKKKTPESGHRGRLPQLNKDHIWQNHNKYHSQWWKTESIPLRSGKIQDVHSYHYYST